MESTLKNYAQRIDFSVVNETTIRAFKSAEVVVIGDIIHDVFSTVEIERPSSEHAGHILIETKRSEMPGGAGNTARNVVELGGKATLISVVGVGATSREVQKVLETNGVSTDGLINDRDRRTTLKHRFVYTDGTYAADVFARETKSPIPESNVIRAIEILENAPGKTVIISDYHRGVVTPDLIRRVARHCRATKRRLIYDIRPREHGFDFSGLTEAYLITPNRREARGLLGLDHDIQNGHGSRAACSQLAERFNTNVLLTRDGEGMCLYEKQTEVFTEIPALNHEPICVSGAGDTVVATLALATEIGLDLTQASLLASIAAGISVAKPGTAVVSQEELISTLARAHMHA